MKSEFNEMIIIGETKKKKGGSLGAVLKLVGDLTDFEEKIQDCIDSQEMLENKEQIEGFLGHIDQMYDVLFEIARGGITSIRSERSRGVEEDVVEEGVEEEITVDDEPEVKVRREVGVRAPVAPKM